MVGEARAGGIEVSQLDELWQHWNNALAHDREQRQAEWDAERTDGGFGASTVSSKCLRIPLFTRANVPVTNPFGAGKQDRFDMGLFVEEKYLHSLEYELTRTNEGYLWYQAEARYGDFYAHTDAEWIRGNEAIAIEIKSIHPRAIDNRERELKKQGIEDWMPYPEHALQVSQFVYLRNLMGEPVSDWAMIHYISLDGRRRRSDVFAPDFYRMLQSRMETLKLLWANKSLPARLEDSTLYPCKDCKWWSACWEKNVEVLP